MRRILFVFFLWVGTMSLFAQSWISRQIEERAGQVMVECALPSSSGVFFCGHIPHPLVIRYNSYQQVEHIGIELFRTEDRSYFGNVICDFHERFFLELYGLTDTGIHERSEEYGIRWGVKPLTGSELVSKKDLSRVASFIREESEGYTLVKDSLRWTSIWQKGELAVSVQYPATFSLLYGLDKKEADDWFERQMLSLQPQAKKRQLEIRPDEFYLGKNGLWVQPGTYKYSKELNNDLYFAADTVGGYALVYDSRYPVETAANLFLQPGGKARSVEINILHRAYGNQKKLYTVSLYDFLLSLQKEYDTYIGFEEWKKGKMRLTVIFHNTEFNSHHLLYIDVDPVVLDQGKGRIEGLLYTYIPNHNIKNLYKEYEEGKPYTDYLGKE